MFSALSLWSEGQSGDQVSVGGVELQRTAVVQLGEISVRERVFLPQQFGLKSLINGLLFALRAAAALAAVHDFGALHLVVPRPGQDVAGGALTVLHHSCHLQ